MRAHLMPRVEGIFESAGDFASRHQTWIAQRIRLRVIPSTLQSILITRITSLDCIGKDRINNVGKGECHPPQRKKKIQTDVTFLVKTSIFMFPIFPSRRK